MRLPNNAGVESSVVGDSAVGEGCRNVGQHCTCHCWWCAVEKGHFLVMKDVTKLTLSHMASEVLFTIWEGGQLAIPPPPPSISKRVKGAQV